MLEKPKVVVGCLIINDGKILLCRSPKWRNLWVVPGGHIEYGETIEEAVKREVEEEVGLNVELEKVLFVQELIEPKDYHKKSHMISLECVCKAKTEKVKIDNREIKEYKWVSIEEGLKMETDPYTHEFIEKYSEGLRCQSTQKK